MSKAIARGSNGARKVAQHGEIIEKEKQKKQVQKSYRHFTRIATHFLDDVEKLDDLELKAIFNAVVTKEEKIKLARISRLLTSDDAFIDWFSKK